MAVVVIVTAAVVAVVVTVAAAVVAVTPVMAVVATVMMTVVIVMIVVGVPVECIRLNAVNTNPNLDILMPNEASVVDDRARCRECVERAVA